MKPEDILAKHPSGTPVHRYHSVEQLQSDLQVGRISSNWLVRNGDEGWYRIGAFVWDNSRSARVVPLANLGNSVAPIPSGNGRFSVVTWVRARFENNRKITILALVAAAGFFWRSVILS
jgi:hypothetical protein